MSETISFFPIEKPEWLDFALADDADGFFIKKIDDSTDVISEELTLNEFRRLLAHLAEMRGLAESQEDGEEETAAAGGAA